MPLFKRNDERGNTETNYKRSRQIGLDTNISNYGWYTCAHCGRKLRKGDVDIDHILPRSKGELMIREIYNVCACIVIAQKEIKPTIRKQI